MILENDNGKAEKQMAHNNNEKLYITQIYIERFVVVLSIIAMLFHLWRAHAGILDALLQRPIHLMFMLVICFLGSKKDLDSWGKVLKNGLLAILSILASLNVIMSYNVLTIIASNPRSYDIIFGIIFIIVILEACRKEFGWTLPILTIIFLVYAFIGPYLPSPFDHAGYSLKRLVGTIYLTTLGIWTIPLGVAANFIILFIFLGAILEESGAGQLFIDFAMALVGSKKGGPAKVAIVSSSFMGMITGNSAANVALTGSFTIPLMKKMGFGAEFAGAVEAVASTNGQIIPPIMGSAAFIMVSMTGIPYTKIMLAAIIPSLLYIIAIYSAVDFRTAKLNIRGLSKKNLPNLLNSAKEIVYIPLPIILIIYLLIIGKSIILSVFYTCILMFIVTFFKKSTRMNFKQILKVLELGARKTAGLSIACACAGIIVGVVGLTGLGLRFSEVIINTSGDNLFFALFLTMVASLILGMGLPTSASYIMLSVLAVPTLIKMGVSMLPSHMFVFYYGCLSAITPPVAIAAYTGAAISGGNQFKTGIAALRLSLGIYIIPFLFVVNPTLIVWDNYFVLIFRFIILAFAMIVISAITERYLVTENNIFHTILLYLAGILLIMPKNFLLNIIGLVIFFITYFVQSNKEFHFLRIKNIRDLICKIKGIENDKLS